MFSLDIRQGRLVEGRIASPLTVAEVGEFFKRLFELLGKVQGQVVICTDIRRVHILSPEIADSFVGVMKRDNPRVLRSGFWLGESPTAAMQVERMIRDGGSPARRTFRGMNELSSWLNETLDPREQARLAAFLQEPGL